MEVDALRSEADHAVARASFLARAKAERPSATLVLAEMTRILPDDTWLTRFEFDGNEVQVRGSSMRASALIGLLEQSELFDRVEFRSPVMRSEEAATESFHIAARVTGGVSAP